MRLRDLYEQYRDRVQFIAVYLREAHPVDGWWLGGGIIGWIMRLPRSKAATDIYDAKTLDERRQAAARCESELAYGITTLVDGMDDSVNRAYSAMPWRLYLLGIDGRVVYAGGLGPFGSKPRDLKAAIETLLSADTPAPDLAAQSTG